MTTFSEHLRRAFGQAKGLARDFRRLILPPLCPVCQKKLALHEEHLCSNCFEQLPFTHFRGKSNNPTERIFLGLTPLEKGYSYIYYYPGSASSQLIKAFKYHRRDETAVFLGRLMGEDLEGSHFFDGIDAIVPVPLARKRLLERGYNQSERLARGLAQATGIEVWDDVLIRHRETPSQTHFTYLQRRENVKDAFSCPCPDRVSGKHLLLIDDVVTTGATLLACCESMKEIPGIRFSVITLALTGSADNMFPSSLHSFGI